jgi:2-keto-3-deoxy-6-phosphogluconate aldolase
VNQQTASNFIFAGATALGIGAELINPEGLPDMREEQIRELARRYLGMIQTARSQMSGALS